MAHVRSTSIAVYRKIKEDGMLSRLRWVVYEALYHFGPCTQAELWSEHLSNFERNSIAPRFSELEDRGVIKAIGERPCRYSRMSQNSIVWDVTAELPRDLETKTKATRRELLSVLEFYADSRTYGQGNGLSWESCDIVKDLGFKAREILEKEKND